MKKILLISILFVFTMSNVGAQSTARHLSLKQAIKLAKENNAQILMAHERMLQSLANSEVSQSSLLPQITGVFGGKRQTADLRSSGINLPSDPHIGPFNSFDTRGKLTMAIFDLEAQGRLKAARASVSLSQAKAKQVKEDILALAASLYLDAKRSQDAVYLNKKVLNYAQFQYDLLKKRLAQGVSSALELQEIESQLDAVKYSYEAALSKARQTQLQLAKAINWPLDQEIFFDDDLQLSNQELKAVEKTVYIEVAEAQLNESKQTAKQIQVSVIPKVVASADLGQAGKSFDESSRTYGMGVNVSVPIWEGGSKSAQLKAAKSKVKENEIQLEDIKKNHEIDLSMAISELDKAKQFLISKQSAHELAKHQMKIIKGKLESGLASGLDIYQAQANEAISKDEMLEADAIYWTAKINLAHRMGRIEELFDI